ncbi:hypothetical protein [Herminiimonas arsenitoxidans]|uniref:hypothetical protein n=1 Tax=Herminiimonas arsenitoxidans TaxID=1809410 RepID=UPI000970F561|nr:hypothetical protein [Herminiimonas arsenitoxidans]
MFKQFLRKSISRLMRLIRGPKLATSPYVIDYKTDVILAKLGRAAREHLDKIPLSNRKKVLFFLGYHHSKFVALNDATIILALQLRGVDVIPVLSGFFYEKEDVIYGGVFNDNRFNNQYRYAYSENALVGTLLSTDPVSLVAFANKQTEVKARTLADSITFSAWRELEYSGFAVGEMAEKLVSNMNNVPAMLDTPDHLQQFRWHVYNVVRLIDASTALVKTINPDSIVSNTPFYYKWRIPFQVAQTYKIPFYSYTLGERKNTLAWATNTTKIFDSSPCWDSFKESDIYTKYQSIVEAGIEDRIHGRISHVSFLPGKNEEHVRIKEIRAAINGRPSILFPVNVLVDAAVLIPTKAFSSCLEMVIGVVEYFREHPEYVCLIKAHPAEKIWKSSGTDVSSMHLWSALQNAGVKLPENVLFIDYDEELSSFNLYELVRGLIAYTSSTCMEISWFGKRVITAHDAHYSCAGFTCVPESQEDFFQKLEKILRSGQGALPDPEIQRLGRIYYLLYYYVCQIDCKLVEGNDIETIPAKLLYDSIDSLLPGGNAALDYVCDSILHGKPIFGENRWPPLTA